ncbi:hypothetical protein INR49_021984 [Caranx melampygus]|nr:hypothetical protein INR49_021984 [Caranx melampygus]
MRSCRRKSRLVSPLKDAIFVLKRPKVSDKVLSISQFVLPLLRDDGANDSSCGVVMELVSQVEEAGQSTCQSHRTLQEREVPVLERLRMLDGCRSLGALSPDIQPPKSLLMSWTS